LSAELGSSKAARSKLRILLVGNYEPDQQQSMARYAKWLLSALKARSCTVLLMCPVPWFSRLAVGPLRKAAIIKYLGYVDKYLIFPKQLRTAAKQFDLVHVCDHSNSMYLRAVSRACVPAVITCHDVLAIRSARGEFAAAKTGWSGKLLQAWILRGLKRARNVICVSQKTAEDLLRLTGQRGARVGVILNPLNWNYKPQAEMPEALRARLGLAASESYFLHVGGNQWYKNRPAVVQIFRELAAMPEYATAKLVMAGKPLPASLKALIDASELADRVIAVIGISNEELQALYSHALALIFPSLEEGFGWPIAEAQACGCVVAATGRAPMTEVAGEAAIFFDPEDAVGAASAIRDGLVHWEALRAAGLRNVERFAEETIVEEYRDFYDSALSNPGSPR
jgi:glycosyltransferase involved in cell wall biosynthesis